MIEEKAVQQVAEDAGKDRLVLVVTLPDDDHGTRFTRAATEIELALENTSCIVVDLAEVKPGEPPPPLGDQPGAKRLHLIGIIRGPERNQIPDGLKDATQTNWFGECVSILESYGLVQQQETLN